MHRAIPSALFCFLCFLCSSSLPSAKTEVIQPRLRVLPRTEAARRALATQLRQRIAKSKTTNAGFWDDVKQLEAIGPPEIKIAVVKHPGTTMLYAYKNINGLAVAEDDVVLGPYERVRAEQALARGDVPPNPALATINRNPETWWPNGVVPFEIDSGLETRARRAIGDAIADYENLTPVRFRERDGENQYVRFTKQLHAFGLASMTNSVGANGGQVEIKLQTEDDNGLKDRAVIAVAARHEIGHALGMFHEHSRKDRDDFVKFDTDCSSYDFWYSISGNYEIEKESKKVGPYDFSSIMHYSSQPGEKGPPWDRKPCFNMVKRASQREPGDDTGEIFSNFFLSNHDINAMHHVYGRNGIAGHADDGYGSALLVHNFDPMSPANDQFPDLAVGAPGRDNGNGAVFLYKGTATGLVLWKILTPSQTENGQRFGAALAAGDFDGDGVQELAVGAPRATVSGKTAAGKVFLFRIRGNRAVDETEIITKPGAEEVLDRFGQSLAAGVLFDNEEPNQPIRAHLAIGAPGARNGTQGRVGRVWVINRDADPKFREVMAGGDPLTKFGQFGFSLTILKSAPSPGVRPRDQLAISAPGVTLGGCGNPAVYRALQSGENLQTGTAIRPPVPASPQFCPQDPNLSDAIDSFPNPVWDATFGSHLVSGDFDGDTQADLAVSESPKVHLYLRNSLAQLTYSKTVSNADFDESSASPSFGTALAVGDLNNDGRDELIVGAPLASVQNFQNVGRAYVYRGCVPIQLSPNGVPRLPPDTRIRPGSSTLAARLCFGGLKPWFRSIQTDFQSQSITVPNIASAIADILGDVGVEVPGQGQPAFPPFTANRANDRFASAIAVMKPVPGASLRIMIGSPNKALRSRPAAGAVFSFRSSITDDPPPFRNMSGLTSDFTTSFDRD